MPVTSIHDSFFLYTFFLLDISLEYSMSRWNGRASLVLHTKTVVRFSLLSVILSQLIIRLPVSPWEIPLALTNGDNKISRIVPLSTIFRSHQVRKWPVFCGHYSVKAELRRWATWGLFMKEVRTGHLPTFGLLVSCVQCNCDIKIGPVCSLWWSHKWSSSSPQKKVSFLLNKNQVARVVTVMLRCIYLIWLLFIILLIY